MASRAVVRSKEGRFRLRIESSATQTWVKGKSEVLGNQLQYALFTVKTVQEDANRVKRALEILSTIESSLRTDTTDWGHIKVLGWWKMLESSGMPASVDAVLRAGFSPRDWIVTATQASAQLALEMGGRHGSKVTLKDALGTFSGFAANKAAPFEIPPEVDSLTLGRVIKVLAWSEIKESTPEHVERGLGLAWFCYTLWASLGLLPVNPQSCAELSEGLHLVLERGTGFKEDSIDEVVDALTVKGIVWAADLLSLPELT